MVEEVAALEARFSEEEVVAEVKDRNEIAELKRVGGDARRQPPVSEHKHAYRGGRVDFPR